MPVSNRKNLEANATEIVRQVRAGEVTPRDLRRACHVGRETILAFLSSHMSTADLAAISRRNAARGRLAKGLVPWNKGRKGIRTSPATEFKAGCLRGAAAQHWRPIGTITVRRGRPLHRPSGRRRLGKRRRWIKVRDDGPPANRWIPLARFVWQNAHGAIPPGHNIAHVDGDTMNDGLANLCVVDGRGLLALQQRIDPTIVERWNAAKVQASRMRHRRNREARKIAGPVEIVWECHACGHGAPSKKPDRCVKCGAAAFEKRRIRQTA